LISCDCGANESNEKEKPSTAAATSSDPMAIISHKKV